VCVCVSVYPTEHLGPHWTYLHGTWHLSILWKSVEKIQFSLKCDKNTRYFTWRTLTICDISLNSSENEKCFPIKYVEKIHNLFMFKNIFLKSYHLWENVEKYNRAWQATDDIRRYKRFSCRITRDTDTYSDIRYYCFSTATLVARMLLSITLYVRCLS
jgi:hypothetical protein